MLAALPAAEAGQGYGAYAHEEPRSPDHLLRAVQAAEPLPHRHCGPTARPLRGLRRHSALEDHQVCFPPRHQARDRGGGGGVR